MNREDIIRMAREALEETLRTLDDENAKPGGAISDTIWYSEHETLFDYIAAQITAIREALAEQPAQPSKPLTDAAIWNTYKNLWMFHPAEEPRLAGDILKFARAIEAAHGIKGDA